MDLATPIKEKDLGSSCEDSATGGDCCGGTTASELSTCCNSSPATIAEAEDSAGSGHCSTATLGDALPGALKLPGDSKEDQAVTVVQNIFKLMKANNGKFGLPMKDVSNSKCADYPGLEGQLASAAPESIKEQSNEDLDKHSEVAQEAELLRRELEAARCELQVLGHEAQNASCLRDQLRDIAQREAACIERTIELEDKVIREAEAVRLERHIFEVEMRRSQQELQRASARSEVLEKELKQAQKLSTKQQRHGLKDAGQLQKEAALCHSKDIMDRHDLALRANFSEMDVAPRQSSKQRIAARANQASTESSWWGLGLCSSVQVEKKSRHASLKN